MTDDSSTIDSSTIDSTTADGSPTAPAPRTRRRAATRPAGPPAADAPEGAADGPTEPAATSDQPADAPAAPAKRARATRTTKAAKAAAAEPATDVPGTEPGDDAPAVPAKRVARKRTAKKAAPAAVTATADDSPDQQAGAEAPVAPDAAADVPAPVKATRKRASRSRATTTAPAPDASTPALPELTEPAAEDDEVDDTDQNGLTEADGAQAATAPSAAAVLFQAPDPAAAQPRRHRRAVAPAGPARTDEATDEPAADAQADAEPETTAPAGRRGGRRRQQPDDSEQGLDGQQPEEASSDEDHAGDGDTDEEQGGRKRRRRGGRGRRRRSEGDSQDGGQDGDAQHGDAQQGTDGQEPASGSSDHDGQDDESGDDDHDDEGSASSRRRRRRRRRAGGNGDGSSEDPPGTVTKVRQGRKGDDEVASVKGSTRLEAKKQRRRDGREAGRRKQIITESEFLARRESVERTMIVRERAGRTQIAVLEDEVLVEHYVANETNTSMIGNVYLGRVQNVLPSMEAAFVDIGKGRNAVLYAGEVNWDAAGLGGQPRRIEQALKSGDTVLVQVTKDPLGHKGARLTSQISLPGRYLVYVPNSSMTGISRKLPDTERSRLKKILKAVVPEHAGVIVRTAAEGASEEELGRDVTRLTAQWEDIEKKSTSSAGGAAPKLLHGEPDLTIRVVRDVFNEDFTKLVVSGEGAWEVVQPYLQHVAPDLAERASRWTSEQDVFAAHRVDEQLAKAMDRKVYLPSGGSLVIDRTEAMTVVDVNTGKFTGSGGNLEETVTRNNLEAAEEIVRQLRLRDIGGIIVVDFIDMVLESNRDLVLRRLVECLGRDRTKHQVAEVTSLGLVQMTRKRVGQGLVEVFSEPCEHCNGRGVIIHSEPVSKNGSGNGSANGSGGGSGSGGGGNGSSGSGSGGSGGGSGRSRRSKGGSGSSSGGSGGSPAAPAASSAQPPRGPIPAGLVASLARHAEHHEGEHHDGEHHDAASSGVTSAVAEESAVAAQRPASATELDPADGSAPQDSSQAPGEAAVVVLSASEQPAPEQPSAQPTSEQPSEPEPPVSKPRRRRRASAPAGPPTAQHDTDSPTG